MNAELNFIQRVALTIERDRLLRGTKRILAAVSGGRDSVAMLLALRELLPVKAELIVGHVHHGLRGKEADEDLAYTSRLASDLHCRLVSERLELPRRPGAQSFEVPARSARYGVFKKWAAELRLDAIATGHTAGDQVETVLLKLFRGYNLTALTGIPVRRLLSRESKCLLIRPMIEISREEITAFLEAKNVPFREDRSNADINIPRNRLRHQVLPILKRYFNTSLEHAVFQIQNEAQSIRENAKREIAPLLRAIKTSGTFFLPAERLQGLSQTAMHQFLTELLARANRRPERISRKHTLGFKQVCAGKARTITLPCNVVIRRDKQQVVFFPGEQQDYLQEEKLLPADQEVIFGNWTLACRRTGEVAANSRSQNISGGCGHSYTRFHRSETVDQARLKFPLKVRTRRSGDRFWPLGAPGRTKLKEFFRARRVPKPLRRTWPVVISGNQIVWVPGLRISHPVRITSSTKNRLRLELLKTPEGIK